MASAKVEGSRIVIDTYLLSAEVHTEGYVSGVAAGTLVDKTTGARDLGFGLDIVDFLLEPLADEPNAPHPYVTGDLFHGHLVKRYVELPQICTQAKRVDCEVSEREGEVTVRQWFRYQEATYGRRPGSLWEQTLVFRDGVRYLLAEDRITSANDVEQLILRIDMPGHLKHSAGDTFERIYLSTHGELPASEFLTDFPPDGRYLYQRKPGAIPERMIRAYQVRLAAVAGGHRQQGTIEVAAQGHRQQGTVPFSAVRLPKTGTVPTSPPHSVTASAEGKPGPWLAGMTLDPAVVYEAWCHQRGYVCFIQEIGGNRVRAGESFGARYVVGWFDSLEEMNEVYDRESERA